MGHMLLVPGGLSLDLINLAEDHEKYNKFL